MNGNAGRGQEIPTLPPELSDVDFRRIRLIREGALVVLTALVLVGMRREAMRLERLSETKLLLAAREAGIRDLREIELAVAEVNGKISFFTATGAESSPAL